MQKQTKPVILLVAEAVTVAHFARIITLAKALNSAFYEVVIASDPRYADLEPLLGSTFHPIYSIPSTDFEQALTQGKPLYNAKTLTRYVKEDLELLDSIKPDLVIGDFRLSLAISAPLRKTPYAAVVNAYWSPFADITYPVPDLSITRFLGIKLAQKIFDAVRPIIFALHASPLNRVRRNFGQPSLGFDLRNVYTWADYTLYADIPELIPVRNLPSHHCYLGPILWSTQTPLPEWWDRLPKSKPVVFMTMGSSGRADLLPRMLAALAKLPVTVIVATARKVVFTDVPANAYITDYLPMEIAVRRSKLVICNGGSLTTYQALANGVPVVGLCANMDQLLNMGAVERLGAGLLLRAAQVSSADLISAVITMLDESSYAKAAERIGQKLTRLDTGYLFRKIVTWILSNKREK